VSIAAEWLEDERIETPLGLSPCLERVAAGDVDALAHLYDRTCRMVFGLAMRILRRAEEAEEIVVDVYTQMWKTAASFDPARGSVEAWLSTMTRSRALDRLRSRKARPDLDDVSRTPLEDLDRIEDRRQPDRSGVDHARFQAAAMLMALAPDERRLIELAFFHGYTHSELAGLLGLPLGTIKTRIRMSVMRMRRALRAPAA
jgi:RNA polymerase sigma-70 factor, ECF subfamily